MKNNSSQAAGGYAQVVGAGKKDDTFLLLVDRNGSTMFLAV